MMSVPEIHARGAFEPWHPNGGSRADRAVRGALANLLPARGRADRIQRVLEQSPEAIALLNVRGRIEHATGPALRILGVSSTLLTRRHIFEQAVPDDIGRALVALDMARTQPRVPVFVEYREDRCGRVRDLEAVLVNQLDIEAVRAIVIVFRHATAGPAR